MTQKYKQFNTLQLHAFVLSILLWPYLGIAQETSTKAEYKKEFLEAITRYPISGNEEEICLPSPFLGSRDSKSVEINNQDLIYRGSSTPTKRAQQFKALEDVGLIVSTQSERMVNNKKELFITYTKTETGEKFYFNGHFCYKLTEVYSIIKWKGPAIFGEYKIALVYFTAKTLSTADWAMSPALSAAFSDQWRSTLRNNPDEVYKALFELSSEGWEPYESPLAKLIIHTIRK